MDLFDRIEAPALPFTLPTGDGYGACWNAAANGFDIFVPDGLLFYAEHFFNPKISDRCVEYFQENDTLGWANADWRELTPEQFAAIGFTHIHWCQEHITFFGKRHALPRLTAWYGDAGTNYTYSNIAVTPTPWNKGLLYLKQQIEQRAGVTFNSVLLNWYRDGADHLQWHSDDEPDLGRNPVIASANFGETRDFALRRTDDHSQRIVLPLKHGTLLVMAGTLQHFWQHAVPKRKRVQDSRFNLTFRHITSG